MNNIRSIQTIQWNFFKASRGWVKYRCFKLSTNDDPKAITDSLDAERQFIFEESIDFKELTVPILNGKCLTPVEIITKESFYNFNAKYVNDDTELNEFIISDKKRTGTDLLKNTWYRPS